MATETILRGVQIGVAELPGQARAVTFVHENGDVIYVPMSDENFDTLVNQWRGVVVAKALPAMAPSLRRVRG